MQGLHKTWAAGAGEAATGARPLGSAPGARGGSSSSSSSSNNDGGGGFRELSDAFTSLT